MAGIRQDQHIIGVTIDGRDLGIFDKLTGGDRDSNETKYRPGGGAPQVSLGGSTMTSNIVCTRLYDLDRDHPLVPWLLSRIGKGVAVVSKQPTDGDYAAHGKPLVYRGILKHINFPDADSEANAAAVFDLEISTEDNIG